MGTKDQESLGKPKKRGDEKINEEESDDDDDEDEDREESKDKITNKPNPKKIFNKKTKEGNSKKEDDDDVCKRSLVGPKDQQTIEDGDESDSENTTPRKRGRPKGSKNKKIEENVPLTKDSKSSETETEKEDKKPKLGIIDSTLSPKKERNVFSFSESDVEKEDFKSLKLERKKL